MHCVGAKGHAQCVGEHAVNQLRGRGRGMEDIEAREKGDEREGNRGEGEEREEKGGGG